MHFRNTKLTRLAQSWASLYEVACASRRVESLVGKGEFESFMANGISVKPNAISNRWQNANSRINGQNRLKMTLAA
jgi:hypothetical protein